ncbi:MAG: DUF5312 domain-containing protein [Spirochaetaceae bacterium]|jgi:hypothetical protein|nr:DUF5312 domain-containing protein [Spirochaetaceae bacterium]
MEANNPFDHLVSDLDQDEKTRLIEKLKMQSVLSTEPLIDIKPKDKQEKTGIAYHKLPWQRRLAYWFISLFTGKAPSEIYLNQLIAASGRDINIIYPGMYDYQKIWLKEGFRHELQGLKEASRFFYAVLDSSVNRARGAFMGYLGSLSLPDIHEALMENTDPDSLSHAHPDYTDTKIRAMALDCIEKETAKIPEDIHATMYQDSRMLFALKALSSFLFDRLIMSFTQNADEEDLVCPIHLVKNQLISLDNILFSIKTTPSMDLLSALFIFSMQEYQGEQGFDEDKELQKFIQKAEKSIAVIRSFNKRVPLTKILNCALRDLSWEPAELPGGEDWFAVYKNYWTDTTKAKFSKWMRDRQNIGLAKRLEEYFDGQPLMLLEYAQTEEHPDGIPVDGILSLSFLLTFHKKTFMPGINVVIRPILIDGEFCSRENRTEFTESYNVLIKLDDVIKEFDRSLSLAGEIGRQWAQANSEVHSLTVRRRKIRTILEEVSEQVEKIIASARGALDSMDKVLNGIIIGSQDGKYNTLTNFVKICGKGTTFMDGLNLAIQNIHNAVIIIDDISAVNKLED